MQPGVSLTTVLYRTIDGTWRMVATSTQHPMPEYHHEAIPETLRAMAQRIEDDHRQSLQHRRARGYRE